MGSRALHDRLEPAEPHPDQFPNTGLSIRPFVDHREPLRLVRTQWQNDPSSGFDLIEDRRRQSLGSGCQQGSIVGRVLAPATRTVSDADGDIGAAKLAQVRFGLACQLRGRSRRLWRSFREHARRAVKINRIERASSQRCPDQSARAIGDRHGLSRKAGARWDLLWLATSRASRKSRHDPPLLPNLAWHDC